LSAAHIAAQTCVLVVDSHSNKRRRHKTCRIESQCKEFWMTSFIIRLVANLHLNQTNRQESETVSRVKNALKNHCSAQCRSVLCTVQILWLSWKLYCEKQSSFSTCIAWVLLSRGSSLFDHVRL